MIRKEQNKILDANIKSNVNQYKVDRMNAEISAFLSGDLNKYEFLTRKDLKYKPNALDKARFEFSPLGKTFIMGLDKTARGYKGEGVMKLLKDIRDVLRGGIAPTALTAPRGSDDGNDDNDDDDDDDDDNMPDLETEKEAAERIADSYEQNKDNYNNVIKNLKNEINKLNAKIKYSELSNKEKDELNKELIESNNKLEDIFEIYNDVINEDNDKIYNKLSKFKNNMEDNINKLEKINE